MAGRPPHVPTPESRQLVINLTGIGTPQDAVAHIVGIGKTALLDHYRAELDMGMPLANKDVANNLYRIATANPSEKGTIAAAIFWMKTRARWREVDRAEDQPDKLDDPDKDL